jgi:hypothetical protein
MTLTFLLRKFAVVPLPARWYLIGVSGWNDSHRQHRAQTILTQINLDDSVLQARLFEKDCDLVAVRSGPVMVVDRAVSLP